MDPKSSKQTFVDSHCHLPLLREPLQAVLDKCRDLGVVEILNVGFDRKSSEESVELAKIDFVSASAGIHPHYVGGDLLSDMDWLIQTIADKSVVAIGEIGLDTVRSSTPRDVQIQWFEAQLEVAQKSHLPVIIHNRSADADVGEILLKHSSQKGVLHCFSSGVEFGKTMVEARWYLSFSGNVTYPNNENLRQILKDVPADRLLLETDAPYLTPVPYRGKKENSPELIPEIYEFVANIRNINITDLSWQIYENYKTLFAREKE